MYEKYIENIEVQRIVRQMLYQIWDSEINSRFRTFHSIHLQIDKYVRYSCTLENKQ